ncbi:hypothetical protein [Lentzea albida]|uniref:hypothetical protein n=1 Tax=Lentzea albida TaxID=65499 RepID=UPI000B7F8236|nr:hypothetical protein [Lentzea albida]
MHSNHNTPAHRSGLGLAERAVRAAQDVRAKGAGDFQQRHDTPERWNRWARRARVARTVAVALQLPVDSVTVADDPDRQYPTRGGNVPGDLITVSDPATGQEWRLLTDFTSPGESWLVLDRCPECGTEVPVVRIACLADLGDYLAPETDLVLDDEAGDPSVHGAGCALVPSH